MNLSPWGRYRRNINDQMSPSELQTKGGGKKERVNQKIGMFGKLI